MFAVEPRFNFQRDKCLICEENISKFILKIDLKEHYLYACSHCLNVTPYCVTCNKSIDVLLSSCFFKCFLCDKLIKITKRETVNVNQNNNLFLKMFKSEEEAKLLNVNRPGEFLLKNRNEPPSTNGFTINNQLHDLAHYPYKEKCKKKKKKKFSYEDMLKFMEQPLPKGRFIWRNKPINNIFRQNPINSSANSFANRFSVKTGILNKTIENKDKELNFSILKSKTSLKSLYNNSTTRRITIDDQENESRRSTSALRSDFAGYNKTGSSVRSKSPGINNTKQNGAKSVDRSTILNSSRDLNSSFRDGSRILNSTISHFNINGNLI